MTTVTLKRSERRVPGEGSRQLHERILEADCGRVAIVSLHPGAGAATAIETLAAGLAERGVAVGVTGLPRIDLDGALAEAVKKVRLPQGTIVATAASVARETPALEALETFNCAAPLGELWVCRVTRAECIPLYGPHDVPSLNGVLTRLQGHSDGPVLVAGAWERRAFSAPEVADAVVLAVGSGYQGTPERSAAAVSHSVEILAISRSEIPVDRMLRESRERGAPLALDRHGLPVATLPTAPEPLVATLREMESPPAVVVMPEYLSDQFLVPLVRAPLRCSLVVKDATRVSVSPVYYRAWLKDGGSIKVVAPTQILAVTTNPTVTTGPDADPREFRGLVKTAVSHLTVHDVRFEALPPAERPFWKFWG